MTTIDPNTTLPAAPQARVVRVMPSLREAAAQRLVDQRLPLAARREAARLLTLNAPARGIDLSLMWATLEESKPAEPRQVCLAVPGSGRTAMLFLSEPCPPEGDAGGAEAGLNERAMLLGEFCAWAKATIPQQVGLAQLLPEPREAWTIAAGRRAGFLDVGTLRSMQLALGQVQPSPPRGAWPAGVEVVGVDTLGADRDPLLIEALESTYERTLDCPELCGVRRTRDILDSHRATGVHDPALWFLVMHAGSPRGCMLLSRCPEQGHVELVYLGLAPAVRGLGVGSKLLGMGIDAARGTGLAQMSCAVDARNEPAVRLYTRAGFRATGLRVALVRSIAR